MRRRKNLKFWMKWPLDEMSCIAQPHVVLSVGQ